MARRGFGGLDSLVTMKTRFTYFVDRALVVSRVEKKKLAILGKIGAYGRGAMRNTIRPPKSSRKATTMVRARSGGSVRARTVTVHGRQYAVPVEGFSLVLDMSTGKPCSKPEAIAARAELKVTQHKEGAGKPPRRGPTDLLRQKMDFGVEPFSETTVVGAVRFTKQPPLRGANTVPQLLDQGGQERIGKVWATYLPHPFVRRSRDVTVRKMPELIRQVKL